MDAVANGLGSREERALRNAPGWGAEARRSGAPASSAANRITPPAPDPWDNWGRHRLLLPSQPRSHVDAVLPCSASLAVPASALKPHADTFNDSGSLWSNAVRLELGVWLACLPDHPEYISPASFWLPLLPSSLIFLVFPFSFPGHPSQHGLQRAV